MRHACDGRAEDSDKKRIQVQKAAKLFVNSMLSSVPSTTDTKNSERRCFMFSSGCLQGKGHAPVMPQKSV